MPSETVITLRKQLREKFPSAHNMEKGFQTSSATTPVTGPREPTRAPEPEPLNPSITSTRETTKENHLPALHRPESDRGPLPTQHFPSGAITEISPAEPSCGLSFVIAALLSEAPEHESTIPLALIDARDRFDPASFTPEECARLLWLRCRDTNQAIRSADLLLRDGNLPFVLLDLSALPARELRRIPNSSWHRLRQLAQSTDTTLLTLTPTPLIPRTSLRLTLTRQFSLHDLHLPHHQLLASIQTQTTRHLHRTA
ncbi:hypothetical protein [Haloferula sp.]|uniref:hypothetical protein n=1 Tax=Haloferula sp. TaxID=2497595 RepID=UPI00329E40C0